MTITQERLKELLHYDAVSGDFTWLAARGSSAKGSKAGGKLSDGYWGIRIDRILYRAHRLAWLYTYGVLPSEIIDHTDRNPLNNALANLRGCSQSENMQNAFYGARGYTVSESGKRFKARIRNGNGRTVWLGSYTSPVDASAAYFKAKEELHKFSHTAK